MTQFSRQIIISLNHVTYAIIPIIIVALLSFLMGLFIDTHTYNLKWILIPHFGLVSLILRYVYRYYIKLNKVSNCMKMYIL